MSSDPAGILVSMRGSATDDWPMGSVPLGAFSPPPVGRSKVIVRTLHQISSLGFRGFEYFGK